MKTVKNICVHTKESFAHIPKILFSFLLLLSLTACSGSSGGSYQSVADVDNTSNSNNGVSFSEKAYENNDASDGSTDENLEDLEQGVNVDIDTEMLVYKCDVEINCDDYEDSYEKLQKLISENDGFIEDQYYRNYSSSPSVELTIRIPSKKYDAVLNGFNNLGVIRTQHSTVENINAEYQDANTSLEIYKEYEKRLISLISVSDRQEALSLQNELTELQIKIAKLESSIRKMNLDVAYSYIDLTLSEKDRLEGGSFFARVGNSIIDSWESFLDFLEELLIAIIYLWYYVVLIIIIILLVRLYRKKHPKKIKSGRDFSTPSTYPPRKRVRRIITEYSAEDDEEYSDDEEPSEE